MRNYTAIHYIDITKAMCNNMGPPYSYWADILDKVHAVLLSSICVEEYWSVFAGEMENGN